MSIMYKFLTVFNFTSIIFFNMSINAGFYDQDKRITNVNNKITSLESQVSELNDYKQKKESQELNSKKNSTKYW